MAIGTAAAIVGSAAIGAVASSRAAKKGADAAENAAAVQAEATREATQLQREIFEQTRADAAPYRAAGGAALSRLASAFGLVPTTRQVEVARAAGPTRGTGLERVESFEDAVLAAGGTPAMAAAILPQNRAAFLAYSPERRRQALETMHWPSVGVYDQLGPVKRQPAAEAPLTSPATEPLPQYADITTLEPRGPDPLEHSQQQVAQIAAGFTKSPGYDFRLKEGESRLLNAARARGMSLSGGALKEVQRFGEGLAADEFSSFMSRGLAAFGDYNNRLAALAGVGQTAAQAGQVAGQNFANSTGNILMQGGANQANARLAGGAIQAGAIGNIGNIAQNAVGNYQLAQLLSQGQVGGAAITGTAGPSRLAGGNPQFMPF